MATRIDQEPPPQALDYWIDQLWGIDPERQAAAVDEISSWGIPHVEAILAGAKGTGRVASVLLVESVADLRGMGVPESKLLSKLRGDRDLWPTWAEIRAGGMLVRHAPPGTRLLYESGRAKGRHSDFLLESEDGSSDGIEFKALGLSDDETAFVSAARSALSPLVPPVGICTFHTHHDSVPQQIDRSRRRGMHREARRLSRNLPERARGIAAAVMVAHGHECAYLVRLRSRFEAAFAQLTEGDGGWVAFHWGNGAPLHQIVEALANVPVPSHLRGVILTGSVALPGSLENFMSILLAPFESGERSGDLEFRSDAGEGYARTILAAVDEASGVRPTLLRVPWGGRWCTLVAPDPAMRILPFNMLLAPDPEEVCRRETRVRE